jgi:membrane protein
MKTGLKVGGKDLADLGKKLFKHVGEDDVSGLAAEMAYRFFLAIFPFFIFLAALGGFVAGAINVENPTDNVMDLIGDALPEETATVFRGELENVIEGQNPGLLSVGIIGTILAAAGGMNTVIKGFNRVHRVEETRKFWQKYALTIGMVVLAGAAIIAAFFLMVAGQVFGMAVAEEIGLGTIAGRLFTLARWPVVAFMLLLAAAFLFWIAPNIKLPFQLISPGAVVFVVIWLVATYAFGFYVSNFGQYNATYGALGAVVILLLWFYLSSFVLLIGAEINSLITREVAPDQVAADERDKLEDGGIPPDKGADLAATTRPSRDDAIERQIERSAPRRPVSTAEKTGFSVLGAVVAGVAAWRILQRRT